MIEQAFDLLIFGAGGHGMVVKELARMLGYKQIGIFDDNEMVSPTLLEDAAFLGKYNPEISPKTPLVIAIGNNEFRLSLSQVITHPFTTLVHPSATVSPSVTIGAGTVVLAGAVVQARSSIGTHNVLNVHSVIDHDVKTGTCVHIRPMAYIGSDATLSNCLTIDPCQVVERFSKL